MVNERPGDAREERHALLRALVPPVAVLRCHTARRLHRVRHLQPHVLPGYYDDPETEYSALNEASRCGTSASSARCRSRARTPTD